MHHMALLGKDNWKLVSDFFLTLPHVRFSCADFNLYYFTIIMNMMSFLSSMNLSGESSDLKLVLGNLRCTVCDQSTALLVRKVDIETGLGVRGQGPLKSLVCFLEARHDSRYFSFNYYLIQSL